MSAFFQAPDLLTSAGQAKDKSRQKPAARSQQWLVHFQNHDMVFEIYRFGHHYIDPFSKKSWRFEGWG